jgi:hypothetical protein
MIAEKISENGGLNTSSRTVGKHLKSMGIETKRSKIEGQTKNIILVTNEFQKLVKKYVPDIEKVTLVTKVTTVTLSSIENQKKGIQKKTLPDNITDVTNVTNVTFGSKEVPQETKVKIEEIDDFEADFPLEGANKKHFRKVEPTHLPCSSCGATNSKGWTLEDRQGKIYCDICAGVEI